jgi:hypothetical protein
VKPWKVLSKERKQIDRDSVELHLSVERGGVVLDKIVSGATFYSVEVGGEVMLPDHSGTSEGHAALLGDALYKVLVKAGVLNTDAQVTGPGLLLAAEDYCRTVPAVTTIDAVAPPAAQVSVMVTQPPSPPTPAMPPSSPNDLYATVCQAASDLQATGVDVVRMLLSQMEQRSDGSPHGARGDGDARGRHRGTSMIGKLKAPPRAIWFVRTETGYHIVYKADEAAESRRVGWQVTKFVPDKRRGRPRRLPR